MDTYQAVCEMCCKLVHEALAETPNPSDVRQWCRQNNWRAAAQRLGDKSGQSWTETIDKAVLWARTKRPGLRDIQIRRELVREGSQRYRAFVDEVLSQHQELAVQRQQINDVFNNLDAQAWATTKECLWTQAVVSGEGAGFGGLLFAGMTAGIEKAGTAQQLSQAARGNQENERVQDFHDIIKLLDVLEKLPLDLADCLITLVEADQVNVEQLRQCQQAIQKDIAGPLGKAKKFFQSITRAEMENRWEDNRTRRQAEAERQIAFAKSERKRGIRWSLSLTILGAMLTTAAVVGHKMESTLLGGGLLVLAIGLGSLPRIHILLKLLLMAGLYFGIGIGIFAFQELAKEHKSRMQVDQANEQWYAQHPEKTLDQVAKDPQMQQAARDILEWIWQRYQTNRGQNLDVYEATFWNSQMRTLYQNMRQKNLSSWESCDGWIHYQLEKRAQKI